MIALLLSAHASANNQERLNQAAFANQINLNNDLLERKNQSVLSYLWTDVYAAALYTSPAQSPKNVLQLNSSMRLELYYYRAIDRQDLIKAAWTTLKKQVDTNTLAKLRSEIDRLHQQFTPIKPGDRYALNFNSTSGLSLDINGQQRFTSRDSNFARVYLGLWLAPNGLSDELRTALLASP